MKRLRFVCGVVLAAAAAAAGPELAGPVSGVVFTPASRAIRPILGFPGAAYLGAPLAADVDWAAVSPDGDCALVRNPDGFSLRCGLRGGEPRSLGLPVPEGEIMTAWSRDSASAAVFYRSERRLRVLAFDGQSWSERETEPPPGTVHALAMGGGRPLLAVAESVWLADPDLPRSIPLPGIAAALAFTGDDNDAVVLDASRAVLHRIVEVRGGTAVVSLALPEPAGGAVSNIADAGGERVLALDRDGRRAWLVDVRSGAITAETPLDCAPGGAQRLALPFLFAIAEEGSAGAPLCVLSTRGGLEAFFVPPTPE